MHKRFTLLLVLALLLSAFPALAEDTPASRVPANARMVLIQGPMSSQKAVNAMTDHSIEGGVDPDTLSQVIEVQTLTEALLMLQSGRADAYGTLNYATARYIAAQNDAFTAIPGMVPMAQHMIATKANAPLLQRVNDALLMLQEAGTLDTLWADFVEAPITGGAITAVQMPTTSGAPTYRVGISGDQPPMDYTTPAGEPAGYNTALLAAISAQLGENFELVTIDGGARFAALDSGIIDLFFWQGDLAEADTAAYYTADRRSEIDDLRGYAEAYVLSLPYAVDMPGWVLLAE